MTLFKFTTSENKIIHITSHFPQNISVAEEGHWSEMSEEEYNLHIHTVNEEYDLNPLPVVTEPETLTTQEKLEAIGISIEDLKNLLELA